MTAADKLRELLATRPMLPNLVELSRWWQTSAELVGQTLVEHSRLREQIRQLTAERDHNLAEVQRLDGELARVRLQHRSDVEGFESALVQEQHEKSILEQVERDLRDEYDAYRARAARW